MVGHSRRDADKKKAVQEPVKEVKPKKQATKKKTTKSLADKVKKVFKK